MRLLDLTAQRRELGGEIERAIGRVLDHEQFIMGPEVEALEARLASTCGASYVVSCASGTDALLLVLLAWGIGQGDAVFLPSFTFASTAECVALLGAAPFFVDVCEDSFNMDPTSLQASLEAVRKCSLRPRAVIAVDLFGQPADYDAIRPIAEAHGLPVLADAAQSFGASLHGRFVGTLGDATATSFFPSKPFGCYGDGGAVITDDAGIASAVRSLRTHGKGRDTYEWERVGVNSRLDTLQAAVLLAKLDVFRRELDKRAYIAEVYARELSDIVAVPSIRPGARSAWAQYTVRTDLRDEIRSHLSAAGIPTAIYYPRPLHKQKAYGAYPTAPGGLATSETLARQALSLPVQPYLAPSAQKAIVEAVHAFLPR
ncbi:MAG: DegT/DnrJ/EryC1/StrS family aminotransferase [Actinomycetota bacterium]|nr:DegT/DnrJ/EryC1/StrS family aminotransferase [Actinomycetota bacterium]